MSKARELAELGAVYDSGALSNRNLIINGAMRVAQRGTSQAFTTTGQAYLIDRFYKINGSSYAPNITMSQETDVPSGSGFINSFKVFVDTATTPASNQNLLVGQSIEGFNVAQLAYGTSDAKNVTLSFWVKANQTGTRGVYFMALTASTNREYMATFTINSAGTWEYKTITIPPNTVSVLKVDNSSGLLVLWPLSTGSGDQIAASTDWITQNAYRGLSGEPDLCATAGNYIQITGVQLEVGTEATPFEHRSFGQELALCQRYYQKSYDIDNYAGDSDYDGAISQRSLSNTSSNILSSALPTRMRALPTVTIYGTTAATNAAGKIRGSGDAAISAVTGPSVSEARMDISFTSNQANSYITAHYTADAEL